MSDYETPVVACFCGAPAGAGVDCAGEALATCEAERFLQVIVTSPFAPIMTDLTITTLRGHVVIRIS